MVTRGEKIAQEMSAHIFVVSAGLVGVCLTVLSLFRVVFRLGKTHEYSDGLIAVDALGFLVACVAAYLSLRAESALYSKRFHTIADWAFLMSLTFMVVVGGLIAYEFV
jgi:multisubunit Na+/H+ antiporter MnhF subunit